ncbi:uncharacterized protein LOC116188132 [Punica granatum]|uniref:Uncharacterized protein LOC116188132 n=1 Tax=Punica granatum TaxID=22663 RepID=A0A6P8BTW7_PUNGR|nr:uncharacterized protein LOC116188132 [Punica granatum]
MAGHQSSETAPNLHVNCIWSSISGDKVGNGTKSWTNLFGSGCSQSLVFHSPVEVGGRKIAKPPREVIERGKNQWQNCLIGWFVGSTPDFKQVTSTVNMLWENTVRVSTRGQLYIFKFSDGETLNWVLESGPWHVGHIPLILQRWCTELSVGKADFRKIPVWVILRNIPMHLYDCTGISYIASVVGKPLYMDKGTAQQTHLDFAKVCVEIDFEDEIPAEIMLDCGDDFVVGISVSIPWVPEKCSKCRVFGHNCLRQQQSSLQRDMQQRLQASGSVLQPTQNMMDQQNQLYRNQRGLAEASSMPLYSTAQAGQANGGDWQEEIYQRIKSLKDFYLQDLNEMYQKIATKLQQHDSLPQHPRSEQLEKLILFKVMLERLIAMLQVPKSEIYPGLKEKLPSYEKQIVQFLNTNRPRRQQGQLPPHHMPSVQPQQ